MRHFFIMDLGDEDLLNPPITKPLFKKKKKGINGGRKSRVDDDFDENLGDTSPDPGVSSIGNKRKVKPRQTFIRTETKTTNIQRWTKAPSPGGLVEEDFGAMLPNDVADGAILTGADMEQESEEELEQKDQQAKKFVPRLDEAIERKVNKSGVGDLNEFAHEYDDMDDYDTINDNHATINPEEEELPMDEDDDVADSESVAIRDHQMLSSDDDRYDKQIGESDDSDGEVYKKTGIVRIIEPLTMEQELTRLTNLVSSLKVDNTNIENQLAANKESVQKLDDRKADVLKKLNDL